uniref:RING-type domain-containing protein n=1 Tax=Branchiostoma floridae TaxID=7739 RepID=C3Y826_BRAFL|eukprot:XP_002607485.1 hypothetical protein BRAFLDRAFT_69917 [Branchiostoma floridae]
MWSTDTVWRPSSTDPDLQLFKEVDGKQQIPTGQPSFVGPHFEEEYLKKLKSSIEKKRDHLNHQQWQDQEGQTSLDSPTAIDQQSTPPSSGWFLHNLRPFQHLPPAPPALDEGQRTALQRLLNKEFNCPLQAGGPQQLPAQVQAPGQAAGQQQPPAPQQVPGQAAMLQGAAAAAAVPQQPVEAAQVPPQTVQGAQQQSVGYRQGSTTYPVIHGCATTWVCCHPTGTVKKTCCSLYSWNPAEVTKAKFATHIEVAVATPDVFALVNEVAEKYKMGGIVGSRHKQVLQEELLKMGELALLRIEENRVAKQLRITPYVIAPDTDSSIQLENLEEPTSLLTNEKLPQCQWNIVAACDPVDPEIRPPLSPSPMSSIGYPTTPHLRLPQSRFSPSVPSLHSATCHTMLLVGGYMLTCGHTLCSGCVEHITECPLCKRAHTLAGPNMALRSLALGLKAISQFGCVTSGTVEDILNHLMTDCPRKMGKTRAEIERAYKERKKAKDGEQYKAKEAARGMKHYKPAAWLSHEARERRIAQAREKMKRYRARKQDRDTVRASAM